MDNKPEETEILKQKPIGYKAKKNKKAVSLLILAVIVLGLTAAILFLFRPAANKAVARVDNNNITQGMYRYSLMVEKESILANYEGWNEKDVWNYRKAEGSPLYGDEVDDWVLSRLIRDEAIRHEFNKLGLSFTEGQNELRKTNMGNEEKRYNGKKEMEAALKKQGIDYRDVLAAYEAYDRFESVFLYYFGEIGVYGVPRADVDAFYAKQHARIKSVFIPLTGDQGAALPKKEQTKARDTAQTVLALASKTGGDDNFDSLIITYNKDTSMTQ